MTTCATCGKAIVRVFVGPIDGWGHVQNPAAGHHYAKPAASRSQHVGSPRSSRAAPPASSVSAGRMAPMEARPATSDI